MHIKFNSLIPCKYRCPLDNNKIVIDIKSMNSLLFNIHKDVIDDDNIRVWISRCEKGDDRLPLVSLEIYNGYWQVVQEI